MFDELSTAALCPYFELVNCCRAEGIRRRQHNSFALCLVIGSQLADGRGLTGTIYTDNQMHRRAVFRRAGGILTSIKDFGDFLFQKGLQIFRTVDFLFLNALAHSRHELFRGLHAHIGHNQRFFEFIEELIINIGIADNQLFNLIGQVFAGLVQTLFQFVKKSHVLLLLNFV